MTTQLTPSEITNLWNIYLGNTMGGWVTHHFLTNVKDEELYRVLETARKDANEFVKGAKVPFNKAKHPFPKSFDENDVNSNATPQFSDNAVLLLKYSLAGKACVEYSSALTTSSRSDVRAYFEKCVTKTLALFNELADLVEKKGLHQPKCYIPTPGKIEKVQKQSFLGGLVHVNRPLTSIEISHLVFNHQDMAVTIMTLKALSQMTKSKELQAHLNRGIEIGNKHLDIFQTLLTKNDLPNLPTWEAEISNSTDSSFSDRVILFKSSILIASLASNYGTTASTMFRKDLGVDFLRLMGEILKFGEDHTNLMIKHGCLDQMPLAEVHNQVE